MLQNQKLYLKLEFSLIVIISLHTSAADSGIYDSRKPHLWQPFAPEFFIKVEC